MKFIVTLLLLATSLVAYGGEDFLKTMVQGKYILVGKAVDSDATFHGRVEIKQVADELIVTRKVSGKVIKGRAAIEPAAGGDARVLRIRFEDSGRAYEETCMVGSDLDNYARISCYLYEPGVKTSQPGLEVFFIDHTAQ